jgi:hypothetical protein
MADDSVPMRDHLVEFPKYIEKMKTLARMANLEGAHHAGHPLRGTLVWLENLAASYLTPIGLKVSALGPGPERLVEQLFEILTATSMYGYDRMCWLADGYFQELDANPVIRKFITSRLPQASQYDATISELMYWGWLKGQGFSPILTDDEGTPDLCLGNDINGNPVYCEVKSLLPGSEPEAIKNAMSKTNRQIKKMGGDDAVGYCLFRVVLPVRHYPATKDQNGITILEGTRPDPATVVIPPQIQDYADEIQRHLHSSSYRSVSRVVLLWEEQQIVGNIPGWVTVNGVRQSVVLEHQQARKDVALQHGGDLLPKATVSFNVKLVPSVPPPKLHTYV